MSSAINSTVIPVSDIGKAKAHYQALFGVEPHTDTPYYVGFNVGGHEVGLNPQGHKSGQTAPTPFVDVDDIEERFTALVDSGAEAVQKPTNVGGGTQIATLKDADGNIVGLRSQTAS